MIGGICCCAESHAYAFTGTLRQLAPPHTPIGLSDWMGLPVSSAGWVICTYSPRLSVYVTGVLAGEPWTPPPGSIVAFGRMVTLVLSWNASRSSEGSPSMTTWLFW